MKAKIRKYYYPDGSSAVTRAFKSSRRRQKDKLERWGGRRERGDATQGEFRD